MTGAIAGAFFLGVAVTAASAPDGIAFQAAIREPQSSDAGGIVLQGTGLTSEATIASGDGLVPGRAIERTLPVSNRSHDSFDVITLRTLATTSSLLDSDPVNGLQFSIEACSVPWTREDSTLGTSYSCPGRQAVVLRQRPIIGHVQLEGLSAISPRGTDYLRLTTLLPSSADNRFQGQTSQIRYSFTGRSSPRA